jgi:hypothetical protein
LPKSRKAQAGPVVTKKAKEEMCAFCGKEFSTLGVTGNSLSMGDNCYNKAVQKGVEWDEDTTLTTLRQRLNNRGPAQR